MSRAPMLPSLRMIGALFVQYVIVTELLRPVRGSMGSLPPIVGLTLLLLPHTISSQVSTLEREAIGDRLGIQALMRPAVSKLSLNPAFASSSADLEP